jgi:GNAT superfamily N-acetyltransferase
VEITVRLLADRLADAPAVADIRWRDWGHGSQPTDLAFWLDTTLREAGRDTLPVTYVAYNADDVVLGAVGMDHHDDIDEWHESDARRWRDVTPWVTGMIVHPAHREHGVGRRLLEHLDAWAVEHGIEQAWAATEIAAGFYQKCGWEWLETVRRRDGETGHILTKAFAPPLT